MIRVLSCEAGVPVDLVVLAYAYSMIESSDKKLMYVVGLQDEPSLSALAKTAMHPIGSEYVLGFRPSFPSLANKDTSVPNTLPRVPKSVTLVPGGQSMSIQARWQNWEQYSPTHVFMFHKLGTTLDLWIDLLFVMNIASVECLYVTDFVESIFNSDTSNPYLTKYFRSSVMPKCHEVKVDGKKGSVVTIHCHDVMMLHRYLNNLQPNCF